MFGFLKNTVNTLVDLGQKSIQFGQQLFAQMIKTTRSLGETQVKIQDSPELKFILNNTIFINGSQFAFPLLLYYGVKEGTQTIVKLNAEDENNSSWVLFVLSTLNYVVFAILCVRFMLKNLVFNSVATLGYAMRLNNAFAQNSSSPSNFPAPINYDRFIKQFYFEMTYVWGTALLSITHFGLNRILPATRLPSYVIDAYWIGFVFFQYPLARDKLDTEEILKRLIQNKVQLLAFGMVMLGFITLMTNIVSYTLNHALFLSDFPFIIISTSITNMFTPLFLIHAHQMGMSSNPSSTPYSKYDPIFLLYRASSFFTELSAVMFSTLLQNPNSDPSQWIKKLEASNHYADYRLIGRTFRFLFIVKELRSLSAFSIHEATRPHMLPFLHELELFLAQAQNFNQKPIVQFAQSALAVPFVNKVATFCTSYIAKTHAGVPPAVTDMAFKLLTFIQVNNYLVVMQEHVKKANAEAINAHHDAQKRRNGNRYVFFGRMPSSPNLQRHCIIETKSRPAIANFARINSSDGGFENVDSCSDFEVMEDKEDSRSATLGHG